MKLVTLAFSTGLTSVYSFPHPTEPVPVPLIETEAPESTEPTTHIEIDYTNSPSTPDSTSAHSTPCDLSEPYCHYFSDLNQYCDERTKCCKRGPTGLSGMDGLMGIQGVPGYCSKGRTIEATPGFSGSPGFKGEFGPHGFCREINNGVSSGIVGPRGPPGNRGMRGPPGEPAPDCAKLYKPKCDLSESYCYYFSDLKMYCDSRSECCERGPPGDFGPPGIDGEPGKDGECKCESGPPGSRPNCENIPATPGTDGTPGFPGSFGPQMGCVWMDADGRESGGLGPPGLQGPPGPPGYPAPPGMPGPVDCGWFPNDYGPPGMPSVGGPPSVNGPPSLAYKPTEEPLITHDTPPMTTEEEGIEV